MSDTPKSNDATKSTVPSAGKDNPGQSPEEVLALSEMARSKRPAEAIEIDTSDVGNSSDEVTLANVHLGSEQATDFLKENLPERDGATQVDGDADTTPNSPSSHATEYVPASDAGMGEGSSEHTAFEGSGIGVNYALSNPELNGTRQDDSVRHNTGATTGPGAGNAGNVNQGRANQGPDTSSHDRSPSSLDWNHAPLDIALDNLSVDENAAGATVGSLSTTDVDAGDTASYAVSDDRFEVVDGDLKLKDGVSLNYEEEDSVSVTVTATDSGGLETEQTFEITVGDVNEAPTEIALDNLSVDENAAGATIGSLSTTDVDAGDSATYAVSDDRFEVVDGDLKLKDGVSLNHEEADSVSVTVTATDSGGLETAQTFEISVGDVNEAPTEIALDNLSVDENAAGATVGSLSTTDVDAGDTATYAVSDDRFEVVDGDLKLKDGVSLNHEEADAVSVTVTATDSGGLETEQTFEISVGDVNEAPTEIALDNLSVDENAAGATVGSLSTTDVDAGDTATYAVSDDRFEVVDGDLKLKDGVSLNHEEADSVSVTVTATDSGGLETAQTFEISVGDVNEAPTEIALDILSVDENVAGATVGSLSTTDVDAGDTATYAVSDDRFEVVDGDLKLKEGVSLNHEEADAVSVTVTATDSGGLETEQTFEITVGDVNEAPTEIALDNLSVDENAEGATVGSLSTTDVDAGDTASYAVSDDRFEVVDGDLKLKDGVSLNHEEADSVSVTVTATDSGGLETKQSFEITVGDVNEAPTEIALDNLSVDENAEGATVGSLSTTDVDAGDTASYAVSDDRFEVVDGDLKLKDGVSLNHEEADSVSVTVTATDSGGLETEQTFEISVGDVNEAPTEIALDNLSVDENAAGATVGSLSTTDVDAGDTATYAVSDDRFEVVDGDLKLKDGVSLNHEEADSVSVTVTATDSGGLETAQTFEIVVGDVNEAPTEIALDILSVDENVAGATVGSLSTTDVDAGDTATYAVSDDRFEVVDGDLKLKEGVSLNHEEADAVSVTVTATDSGGLETEQTFEITVGDVNEAPTEIALDNLSVDENAEGATVGSLSTTDVDAGDTASYAVSDDRFEVVDGDLKLKDGVSLNHEEADSVSVTVTATDSGGLETKQSFEITVGDVNEAPTEIALDNLSVDENAEGATVGSLSTTDVDAGDTASYAVSDDRFEVVDGDLKLKDGVSLNHEEADSVSVTVTATDSGGLETEQTFEISVGDVNEAPTEIALDNLSVDENAAGATVGSLSTTDVDAGDTATYAVSDDRFEVVDGDLKLKDGVSLNHEEADSVSVTVTATDSGGLETAQTFEIAVGDVNEAPTEIALDNLSVDENAAGATVGSLSTTDVDAGDTASYAVSDDRFEVVDGDLKLKDGVSLNHEEADSVSVTVTATDSGGLETAQTFEITVGDVNEAPTEIALDNLSVDENAEGATVGSLSTTDVDAGDTASYAVSDDRFEVVDGDLKLKDGVSLNHEEADSVSVTVTATDSGGLETEQTFEISVGDVNEAPTEIALDNLSVDENAAGATVGSLSTTDVDAGDTATYAVSDDRFEVVDGDLKLKDGVSLNHEEADSVSVTVTATDSGGLETAQIFEISVGDVNEAPTEIALDNLSVDENAAGATVGSLSTTDVDAGDTATYAVSDDRFEVVDGDLKLKDGVSLNHEEADSVSVTVTATDSGGLETAQTFEIAVGDVNEAPTEIALDNLSVDENAAGATVGSLSTTDVDAGDTASYAVSDDRFEVVDGDLKLKDGVSLNHEEADSVSVTVTATDSGGLETAQTFEISVGDVNEAPTEIALDNLSVDENAAGATVGSLSTTDVDAGDTATYAVSDDRFEVVDGDLKLKDGVSLNHEEADSVSVTVTATDSGGLETEQTFEISVGDVNEAPTEIALDNLSVDENAAGATVGSLSTTDVDAGDTATYAVSDDRFEVVDGDLKLKDGVSLNHEEADSVSVTVTATDSGGLETEQTFEISVGDVNEAPTEIALDNLSVDENAAGATVGSLSTTDVDAGDTATYAVSDDRFEVVDGDLKLKDGVSLNHEEADSVSVTVTATDSGGLETAQTFEISVGDVNEAPTEIALDILSVDENVAGATVGSLSTTDVDAGDTATYAVSDDRFEVVDGDLKLKDGVSLNHEEADSVSVTVTATDSGGLETAQTFEIVVGDVNEAPTEIALDNLSVDENAAGATVGSLSTADVDAGDTATYAVSDDRFEVVDGDLKLKDGVSLNHEEADSVFVTVTATDSGGLETEQTFEISVGDVNEAPTEIALDNLSVDENAAGATVGSLSTTDVDAGDTATYAVSDDRFEVVDGDLKLKDGVSLNHEEADSVSVTVTATDSGGLETEQTFEISVGDVNEAPTEIALDNLSVDENAAGATVGSLSTTDVDAGDTATYAVSDDRFEVVDGDLKLKDGVSLNHEEADSVSVTVTATDSGGLETAQTFEISVGDVNEAPTEIALDILSVDENVAGATVGSLSTTDVDAGDTATYAVSDDRFEVVDGDLKLKDGVSLNHEEADSVSVTVTATDSGGLETAQTFEIVVGDVNEAPTEIALDNLSVDENAAGATVGSLSTADVDAGDTATYAVSDDRFEVVDGDLKLKDGVSLNHEEADSVFVTVTATDSGGLETEQTFEISVGDVNEAPTEIALDNLSVDENAEGATVGSLSTTDVDAGDTATYAVSDDRFEVVDGDLKLKDGVSLNHEEADSVSVTVTATDSGGLETEQTFEISVGDVNEAPTEIALDNLSVDENAAGATVGSLSTTDVDAGDTATYAVSDDRFEVVDGDLKLKDGVSLNHEEADSVSVTVTATDSGGLETEQTFEISVGDVNEAPTEIALDNLSVDENAAGATVGSLSTTDVDAGDTATYAVSDDRFEVVDGDLKLKDGVSLNHEEADSVSVTVTATDSGGLETAQTFEISVGDVNEAPTEIALDNLSVDENAEGATVGSLSTTDVDAGDTATYAVSDDRFEVVDGDLKLKDGVSLNHEEADAVSVTVTATDSGGLETKQSFEISVGDVNEAPTEIALDNLNVDENAAGATIGSLSTTDVDAGDTATYAVSDDRFEVIDGDLKLKDGVSLNHEEADSVSVTVTATDSGGLETEQTFEIAVGDVNEAPTEIALDNLSVDENAEGATVGSLSTTDVDAGDTASYAVSDDRFEVVDGDLKLKDGVSLNHEEADSVSVTVTATDSGGLETEQTFEISVGDVNEAPTEIALDNLSVDENAAGATVGFLTTTDVDAGDTATYAVSDDRFEVVDGDLKLKDGVSLNHEEADAVSVTVTATDSGGLETKQSFEIAVGDVNEAPTEIALDNLSVDENAAGATVGSLSTTDVDAGDTATYAVSDDRFEVVDGDLKLKDGVSLNHEEADAVSVTVTATDSGGLETEQTFEISVGDVNEAPTEIALDNLSVDENAAGATVGSLTTTDVDAGDTATYAVSDDRFEVVDGDLKLKDGVSLNHEEADAVSVTVTATDSGGLETEQSFEITVGDVNEAPTEIALDNLSVDENAAGATVGSLSTTDVDAGDTASYAVSDDRFEVVDGALKLKDGVSLNHEEADSVSVTVTATDSGGLETEQSFEVAVGDVNEAPTEIALDNLSVDENAQGATVGSLSTTDVDAGDTASYAVSDDRFEVVDGDLKLKDGVSLNHEEADAVSVTVTATDSGGLETKQSFEIAVGDENEAPTEIALDNLSVDENAAGATVGSLSTTDVDAGDTATYAVSDDRFEVVDGDLKLKDDVSLNHEEADAVSVTVTATDSGGLETEQSFEITVGDVNEAPTEIALDNLSVDENAAGATVGSLSTTDVDAGDSATYAVSDDRFEVVDGDLKLKDGVSLNHEEADSVSVTVTATDSGGLETEQTFEIAVGDVNEAPTEIALDNLSVDENAAGATVGSLSTTDVDAGDTATYAVSDDRFEVVDGALKLKDGVSLNYEEEDSVSVTVTATDPGGLETEQTFEITVGDVDEVPTGITLDNLIVYENSDGVKVGSLSVTNLGIGETVSYTVSDDRFEVVDGDLKLKDGVSLNHEEEDTVSVTITVPGDGLLSTSQTFDITVGDINEAPVEIALDNLSVAENAAGATIGALSSTDVDAGDTATYAVSDDRFEIVDGDLKLKDGVSLNHEEADAVSVTVTATDTGGLETSETFEIAVTDVNEAPVDLELQGDIGSTTVTLTFQSESAGYNNTLGVFYVDEDGNPVAGEVVWSNGNQVEAGASTSITFEGVEASAIGYFLIPDGDSHNANLVDGMDVSFSQDENGDWQVVSDDGTPLSGTGANVYFSGNASLNVDGADHTIEVGNTIYFEDLYNNGDADFGDLIFTYDVEGTAIEEISVTENVAGEVVGTLISSDPDVGDVATYTVSDDRFEVVDGELKLKADVSFDHEETDTVSVTVTATDMGGLEVSKTFEIAVGDVNEAPIAIELDNLTVDENAEGATVGSITTIDLDANDTATYIVSDDRFEIVDGELKLKEGVSLDFEAGDTVSVTVTATDLGGLTHSEQFEISVADVAEGTATLWSEDFSGLNDGVESDTGSTAWSSDDSDAMHNAVHGVDDEAYRFGMSADSSNSDEHTTWSSEEIDISGQESLTLSFDLQAVGDLESSGSWQDHFKAYVVIDGERQEVFEQLGGDSGSETHELTDFGTGDTLVIEFEAKTTASSEYYNLDNIQLIGTSGSDDDSGDDNTDSSPTWEWTGTMPTTASEEHSTDENIYGTKYADNLYGNSNNEYIDGGKSSDYIDGGAGHDTIDGGDKSDVIYGGEGDDTIYGGKGSHGDTIYGGDGDDTIDGEKGNDYIQGDAGNDVIYGDKGSDTIYGGTGNDAIDGGNDGDYISGGEGNDLLLGGDGSDQLYGGAGNDVILGGEGDDYLSGGEGSDLFIYQDGDGSDTVLGGAGWTDTISLQDSDGGEMSGDWTVTITNGSTTQSGDGYMNLSDDADGYVSLEGGETISFQDIERIEW